MSFVKASFVKVTKIASEQGVDPRTVRRWLRLGILTGSNVTGHWMVTERAYVEFRERQERGENRNIR